MKPLYDIPRIYQDLLLMLENGDIDYFSFKDTIESLGANEEVRIIDLAYIIKNKQAEIVALDFRIDEIKSKLKIFENRRKTVQQDIDMFTSFIDQSLKSIGKTKIKTEDFDIKYLGKKAAVEFEQGKTIADVDDDFIVIKEVKSIDKAKAYEALKSKKEVKGLKLGSNKKLVIK